MRSCPRGAIVQRGFTIIELMVTIAVLAILAAIAAPSFTGLINDSRLSGAANELVGTLQFARAEALRRGRAVEVCRSSDGATCAGGAEGTAWEGWVVRMVFDGDVVRADEFAPSLSVRGSEAISNNRILFRPDGFAYGGGNLLAAQIGVCMPVSRPANNHRVVRITGGSGISARAESAEGACPQPLNAPAVDDEGDDT